MAREVDHQPDWRLGAVVLPVVALCTIGPVVWAWSVRDRLPAEVVRHWGADGRPTATWELSTQLWSLTALTLLTVGACVAPAMFSRLPLLGRRVCAGTAVWVAVLFAVTQVEGLRLQLDVADPLAAGSIGPGMLVGAAFGAALGLLVSLAAREEPHVARPAGPPAPDAPRLATGAPRAWRSAPMTSRALLWTAGAVVLVFVLLSVPAGVTATGVSLWLFGVLLAIPLAALARVVATVDEDGLTVRASGIRLLHVPLADIARADVLEHVDPLWEFGGWGLRTSVSGRTGVVSRRGEALDVRRSDGAEVVVTVDDAATAAATLNTLLDGWHADVVSRDDHSA